ncbi:histidine kinase [Mucilaginibacter pallidiroseus]|uniref:Histidine kinase n=1 Tax=Mucilaginibacter pallidiroseus TaxID=2599295 RepID=A0A563UFB2_9SPHI|nr:two-component regulator propeller domain-containing protein [Mucilaginibacter pallidiroseus]TWR29963.1 histidine kinase [Mucilaginibacter pallidiroseus]
MAKYLYIYILPLITLLSVACTQQPQAKKVLIDSSSFATRTMQGPNRITRNIIQDKKGNIWMATFGGVYKYDGKYFTNITAKVTSARFFSILQDRKGNFWFGSVNAGTYRYDGKYFEKLTSNDGLLDNGAGAIFEDYKGNIWLGGASGITRYNGHTYDRYILKNNGIYKDFAANTKHAKHLYGVTTIIEDKHGTLWVGAGGMFRFNGKSFVAFNHNGRPFKNIRSVIEDKKGNIWIGGADGLWRYDGNTIMNITKKFVGYVYQDKAGNIWTSSERADNLYNNLPTYKNDNKAAWALSRYDANTLYTKKPTVTEVAYKPIIFGILEDDKGNIWFGDFDGVHRYDGKTITDFKVKK